MADDIDFGSDVPAMPDAGLPEPAPEFDGGEPVVDSGEKKGFFSTTIGKIVLIGGALSGLAIVAGVAFVLVSTFLLTDAIDDAAQELGEAISQGQAGDSGAETTDTPGGEIAVGTGVEYSHADVELTDVHVWRDVFQPLLTPIDPDAEDDGGSTGTTGTAGGGSSQYDQDTLYLLDILTGTNESAAQFYYNGIDYNTTTEFTSEDNIVVMEGERLDDTPWRLLSIGVTSVTLQYGDSTVALSVGQGIRK